MSELEIGKKYQIHSYKHDGSIHRAWDEAILLEEHEEYLIFGNDRTPVIESDGRTWKTKEPAVLFFYKKRWFNIISQKKKDGIYYYCNMASPYIIEDNTIKYIDYDLDLRVFADGTHKVLDKSEYKYHKELMHYSEEIDKILNAELKELILYSKQKQGAFDKEKIEKYYEMYERIKKNKKSIDKNIEV
jgi:protein associated with RNAse G/E